MLEIDCATALQGKTRVVRRVIVSGLISAVTDAHITTMMRNIGEVTSVLRRHDTYAFVDFQHHDDAATAVAALNGSTISTWTQNAAQNARPHTAFHHNAKGKGAAVVSVQLAAELGGVMMQNATVKVLWYRPETTVGTGRRDVDQGIFARRFGLRGQGQERGRERRYQPVVHVDDHDDGTAAVRRILEEFGPLSSFEKQATTNVTTGGKSSVGGIAQPKYSRAVNHRVKTRPDESSNKRKALVKFAFSEDARRAVKAIAQKDKIPSLGGTKLFIESVYTIKFTLLNSVYAFVGREVPLPHTLITTR